MRYVVGDGSSGPGGGAHRKVRDMRSMLDRKAVASLEYPVCVWRLAGSVAMCGVRRWSMCVVPSRARRRRWGWMGEEKRLRRMVGMG